MLLCLDQWWIQIFYHLFNNKILTELEGTRKWLLLSDALNILLRAISTFFITNTRNKMIPTAATENILYIEYTVLLAVESALIYI